MNDIVKGIFKWLFIALLIIAMLLGISHGLNILKERYDWNFTPWADKNIDSVPLENGMAGQLNGDLTVEEITKQKEDAEAPVCEDISSDFYLLETGDYVTVIRKTFDEKGNRIYPNLVFAKKTIDSGTYLELDGTLFISATVDANFWGKVNFDTLTFNHEMFLGSQKSEIFSDDENFKEMFFAIFYSEVFKDYPRISYSNFRHQFCEGMSSGLFAIAHPTAEEKETLEMKSIEYVNTLVNKYFTNLGEDVEFIQADKNYSDRDRETTRMLNSYFTYLWRGSKTKDGSVGYKLIDSTDYFARFIYDEEIYKQYPIPASKKSEYPNQEYYTVYNCKIYADCMYTSYYPTEESTITTVVYPPIEPPTVTKEYAKLNVKFKNKDNSDISLLDLRSNPVVITIGGQEMTINSNLALSNGKYLVFEKGQTCFYEIESGALTFDSYSGNIALDKTEQTIYFEYTYSHGFAYTTVSLMPITATDSSSIDLSVNPVRIVFTGLNGEGTYQFVFDSNDKLTSEIGQFLKNGEYSYSVLSEQLIFSSTSGNQVINANNRKFAFSYSINTYQNDLRFTVDVQTATTTSTTDLKISATTATTTLLGEKIGQAGYKVVVKIFDKDGYILKTLNHTHSAGTSCIDAWQSNGVLTVGETYTGQLLYQNTNDPTKSYVSGTFTFTYQSNTAYTFVYSCVEI